MGAGQVGHGVLQAGHGFVAVGGLGEGEAAVGTGGRGFHRAAVEESSGSPPAVRSLIAEPNDLEIRRMRSREISVESI